MTITLSNLPDELQSFVEAKVAEQGLASAEEYIIALLQREASASSADHTPLSSSGEDVSEEEMRQRIQRFHEELLEKGLLREIKPPPVESAEDHFEPIRIEGPPLSQTIIEDRR